MAGRGEEFCRTTGLSRIHPAVLRTVHPRTTIVCACLTLVQAWVVAGMRHGSVHKGSFEKWAGINSGVMEIAGIAGLEGNRDEVDNIADIEADTWERWVAQWWKMFGDREVTASELAILVDRVDSAPIWTGDEPNQKAMSIRIGTALNLVRDRNFVGLTVKLSRKNKSTGSRLWKLTEAS